MFLIFILLIAGLFLVRSSTLLKTFFHQSLNSVGFQINDHIYTAISQIHHHQKVWFDFVLLGHHHQQLHGYRILHQNYFDINLSHVPVGHKLTYLHQGEEKQIPYMSGTPFRLSKGELILHRNRKKGLGFIHEEVARGIEWPL